MMSTNQATEPSTRADDLLTPRIYVGLVISFIGLFIFAIGAKPAWFGWDRSPVVGFVQIAVFLFGLALICLGGTLSLHALWWGNERTIMSDIGSRLVGTGYVVTVFAGLADIFGMGSQTFPNVPYFGPWQASGVLIGQGIIAIGFLLLIPYRFHKKTH
jgi:ABC-type transport system involved in cytochrome c biogenesis permease subunit